MHLNQQQLQNIIDYQPIRRKDFSLMQAAVAIILRDTPDGTEFLMMQRAKHENDPWSGQMSFPGGKIEKEDSSPKATAIRETAEEVGLRLQVQDLLGQLDDVYGLKVDNKYSVHVSCFVFKPERSLQPLGNYEVADLVWLPMSYLQDIRNAHDYYHPHGKDIRMPAVLIDEEKEQILWGLSLRMVSSLYELLDLDLPVLTDADREQIEAIDRQSLRTEEISKMKNLNNKRVLKTK